MISLGWTFFPIYNDNQIKKKMGLKKKKKRKRKKRKIKFMN